MVETIEQRTEWLREFQEARHRAGYALGAIAAQLSILDDAGLNSVASKLEEPLRIAEESVAEMDEAVSRMIHEEAQDSWNQIGETFTALLQSCGARPEEEVK